jgi:hypothetical protein
MVRAHLDVADSGPRGDTRPQALPVAMFAATVAPPTQPSQSPTWSRGWDPTTMAQTFSTTGQHHLSTPSGLLTRGFPSIPYLMLASSLRFAPLIPLILLRSWLVMGHVSLSPLWVLLQVPFVFPTSLLPLRWSITSFPFVSLQLTIHVLLSLTPLALL